MSRIETKDWKEFKVGDLFDACLSKDDIQPTDIVEGNTPLISSGKENNGIIAYISDDKAKLWNAGTITVDMFGKAFYQTNSYHCVSHGRVNILIPKVQFSERVGKYIACVIEMVSIKKYQFTEMCTGKKLLKDIIKLPVNDNENPDWNYMEDYIKNLEDRVKDTLDKFSQKNTSEKIDTRDWKEFKLGYLNDSKETRGTGLFQIVNSVAYHGKDIEETDIDNPDGLNYVTRSKFNNGLKCKVINKDAYITNPKGTISFGAENADFFYQTEPYITGNKMYYLDTSNLSELACIFLKSILETTFTANYSFTEGMIPAKIYNETIKLPVNANGEPDWVYMEEYMKQIELKAKQKLDLLKVNEASFAG